MKQFTELMRWIETQNDILVLSGGDTFRGEKWQDKDNLAQSDERITALLKDASFREDAKEGFIQQMEIGWGAYLWGEWQPDGGAPQRT